MYNFPPRSWHSDLHARKVAQALATANAGQDFMVSVVTTQSGQIYVALSGGAQGNAEARLRQELGFGKSLEGYKKSKAEKTALDRVKRTGTPAERPIARQALLLNDAARRLENRAGGVYVVVATLSRLNRTIMDAARPSVMQRVRAYEQMLALEQNAPPPVAPAIAGSMRARNNPLSYPNPRNCAEPKVLQGVYDAGERPTGMTTIWYGAGPNPYPAPGAHPGLNLARPCEFCQLNEQRIMLHLSQR